MNRELTSKFVAAGIDDLVHRQPPITVVVVDYNNAVIVIIPQVTDGFNLLLQSRDGCQVNLSFARV